MPLTIGELSANTGVPVATLRDWDRRHGVSPSQRTMGGHRRYTPSDAAMVERVRDLVAGGLRLRASVNRARLEALSASGGRAADQAATEHQLFRDTLAASRQATILRRDQLVAERQALVARRKAIAHRHAMGLPNSTAALR